MKHLRNPAAVALSIGAGLYLLRQPSPEILVLSILWATAHLPDLYALAVRAERFRLVFLLVGIASSFFAIVLIWAIYPSLAEVQKVSDVNLWTDLAKLAAFSSAAILTILVLSGRISHSAIDVIRLPILVTLLIAGPIILCYLPAILSASLHLLVNAFESVGGKVFVLILVLEVLSWSIRRLLTEHTEWFRSICPSCGKRVRFRQLMNGICQCPECAQHFLVRRRKLPDEILDYGSLLVGIRMILAGAGSVVRRAAKASGRLVTMHLAK